MDERRVPGGERLCAVLLFPVSSSFIAIRRDSGTRNARPCAPWKQPRAAFAPPIPTPARPAIPHRHVLYDDDRGADGRSVA